MKRLMLPWDKNQILGSIGFVLWMCHWLLLQSFHQIKGCTLGIISIVLLKWHFGFMIWLCMGLLHCIYTIDQHKSKMKKRTRVGSSRCFLQLSSELLDSHYSAHFHTFHFRWKFGMMKSKAKLNIHNHMMGSLVQFMIGKLIGHLKPGRPTGAGWQGTLALEVGVGFCWRKLQECLMLIRKKRKHKWMKRRNNE